MDNSTLNISIHICIYERRVDPKVPGSSPTVSRNVGVHYLLQSSILLLEITICLNISIHICIYERRVDPKVPGSSPTVSRNVGVHYLLQSSILLLEITICLHITFNLPYISEIFINLH